mmetsp:Transcript_20182/g.49500  ORF Transcript_20182/g.49500 Transcript_20182/m.49500 type:complete len:308 (+) Transcript_20182:1962-2885(+)
MANPNDSAASWILSCIHRQVFLLERSIKFPSSSRRSNDETPGPSDDVAIWAHNITNADTLNSDPRQAAYCIKRCRSAGIFIILACSRSTTLAVDMVASSISFSDHTHLRSPRLNESSPSISSIVMNSITKNGLPKVRLQQMSASPLVLVSSASSMFSIARMILLMLATFRLCSSMLVISKPSLFAFSSRPWIVFVRGCVSLTSFDRYNPIMTRPVVFSVSDNRKSIVWREAASAHCRSSRTKTRGRQCELSILVNTLKEYLSRSKSASKFWLANPDVDSESESGSGTMSEMVGIRDCSSLISDSSSL